MSCPCYETVSLSPVCSPACPSHSPKTMIAGLREDIIVYNKNVLYLINLLGIPHLRLVVGQFYVFISV